jgi:chromosome segregation ATPase
VVPLNEEQYAAIREELAANQKEHESYNRRLREHDEKLEKQGEILLLLERLTNTVKSLTENMGEVKTSVQSMDRRLDVIEREPGDNWRKASWEIFKYVLLAIIAGVIGYVLKQ